MDYPKQGDVVYLLLSLQSMTQVCFTGQILMKIWYSSTWLRKIALLAKDLSPVFNIYVIEVCNQLQGIYPPFLASVYTAHGIYNLHLYPNIYKNKSKINKIYRTPVVSHDSNVRCKEIKIGFPHGKQFSNSDRTMLRIFWSTLQSEKCIWSFHFNAQLSPAVP